MLDRLFMPALTFTLLVAATAAFAAEFNAGPSDAAALECVVASAATQAVALLEPAAAALR